MRGLMVGLLLGDAYEPETSGWATLESTCAAQLACFTAEGLIRASVRLAHKGICHPPSGVWHAWCRWASLQRIQGFDPGHWATGGESWPDGWLSQVAPLVQRRGSAPSTVAALIGSPSEPRLRSSGSAGYHAVTNTLPVALYEYGLGGRDALVHELASSTHGDRETVEMTVAAVAAAANFIVSGEDASRDWNLTDGYGPGTAVHALHHAFVAIRESSDYREVMRAVAKHGPGASTLAGALFGAWHGIAALPADDVSRLRIGWVADRLARDAYLDATEEPGGTGSSPPTDPTWWNRYPGW